MKKEETIKLTKSQYKKLTSKIMEKIKDDVTKEFNSDDVVEQQMFSMQMQLTYMLAFAQLGDELFK